MLLLLMISGRSLPAQTPAAVEAHELKATFLFNFTQFVAWPDEAFVSPQSTIIIGILGSDPAGDFLKDLIAGEKVQGRPLVVAYYKNVRDVKKPHILYIREKRKERLAWMMKRLAGRNILTVGDADAFLQQGGIIRFRTISNKITLEINPENARAANLKISAKLLRLAEIEEPDRR